MSDQEKGHHKRTVKRINSYPTLALLGRYIRFKRKTKEMTQIDLAKIFEVSQSCISKFENGQLAPDVYQAIKFCRFMDITPDLGKAPGGQQVVVLGRFRPRKKVA